MAGVVPEDAVPVVVRLTEATTWSTATFRLPANKCLQEVEAQAKSEISNLKFEI